MYLTLLACLFEDDEILCNFNGKLYTDFSLVAALFDVLALDKLDLAPKFGSII